MNILNGIIEIQKDYLTAAQQEHIIMLLMMDNQNVKLIEHHDDETLTFVYEKKQTTLNGIENVLYYLQDQHFNNLVVVELELFNEKKELIKEYYFDSFLLDQHIVVIEDNMESKL